MLCYTPFNSISVISRRKFTQFMSFLGFTSTWLWEKKKLLVMCNFSFSHENFFVLFQCFQVLFSWGSKDWSRSRGNRLKSMFGLFGPPGAIKSFLLPGTNSHFLDFIRIAMESICMAITGEFTLVQV